MFRMHVGVQSAGCFPVFVNEPNIGILDGLVQVVGQTLRFAPCRLDKGHQRNPQLIRPPWASAEECEICDRAHLLRPFRNHWASLGKDLGQALTNHYAGRLGIAGDDVGHDRRVGDAKIVDAIDLQL